MKRLLFVIFCVLFSLVAKSQNCYKKDTIYTIGTAKYKCEVGGATVYLYSDNPKFRRVTQISKSKNRPLTVGEYRSAPPIAESPRDKIKLIRDVIGRFFDAEKMRLIRKAMSEEGDDSVTVSLYIDPTTGEVAEVEFSFLYVEVWAQFPVSLYYDIEQALKREVRFTLTDSGRDMNYVFVFTGFPTF